MNTIKRAWFMVTAVPFAIIVSGYILSVNIISGDLDNVGWDWWNGKRPTRKRRF